MILTITFIFNQELDTDISFYEKLKYEIESIESNIDKEELFLLSFLNRSEKNKKINFFKK